MCGCLSHPHPWGPGLQPRQVPLLEIKPATLWFAGPTQSTEPYWPGLLLPLTGSNIISFGIVRITNPLSWASILQTAAHHGTSQPS